MKTLMIATLALIQVLGMQTAMAGAKAEFQQLAQQRKSNNANKAIFSAIRAQGCDTNVLDSERDSDGYIFVSTQQCSCQVYVFGAEGSDRFFGNAKCVSK